MATPDDFVFLLDVDNTLLDNDRFIADLMRHFAEQFGTVKRDRYRALIEELRAKTGYVDYLGALRGFQVADMNNLQLQSISAFLMDYPFSDLLYPGALEVIAHLSKWGRTVILSDGDAFYQPRKIRRSGIWSAVEGRVLVYVHKEKELDAIARQYPARHYLMVDDKLPILQAMKSTWRDTLTTIMPLQGHYALDIEITKRYDPADIIINRIGDLLNRSFPFPPDANDSPQHQSCQESIHESHQTTA